MRILYAAVFLAMIGGSSALAESQVGCEDGIPSGSTVTANQCQLWDTGYVGYYAPSQGAFGYAYAPVEGAFGYAYAPAEGAFGYAYAPAVRRATTIPRTDKARRLREGTVSPY